MVNFIELLTNKDDDISNCQLMGITGMIIQVAIGIFSLLTLFVKRYYEKPKRKYKVFLLDGFKQLLSCFMIHMLNVLVSVMLAKHETNKSDECSSYFISFLLDTTLGLLMTQLLLKAHYKCFPKEKHPKCQQGYFLNNHGNVSYEAYVIQCLVWIGITFFVKTVIIVILYANVRFLINIGDIILTPFNISSVLKLIFVVLIVPLFCNSLIFLFCDTLLKLNAKEQEVLDIRYYDIVENSEESFNFENYKTNLI